MQERCTPAADDDNDVPALCRECEARHRGICGVLTAAELRTLSRHSTQKVFEKGTTLVSTGEANENYANVLNGVVKLTKTLRDGRQQIVALQFAPDFLGRALAESSPVDAETASSVKLCRFPRAVIDRMMRDVPELQGRIFEQVLAQLDEARGWILTLGRKTATEKVASFLLLIMHHIDPQAAEDDSLPQTFELPLSRADIADFLGLTLETVSRQMTKLRQSGAIAIAHNRTITVLDRNLLFELSGGD
jgi:CRP/FNR family transcriptional regulator, anaerobic regulatory protein